MTDDDTRPTWLHEPCPTWCRRHHREDDHPEDRRHEDGGVVISTLAGEVEPESMKILARSTELVIRRTRALGETQSWLTVHDAESAQVSVIVSWEATTAALVEYLSS